MRIAIELLCNVTDPDGNGGDMMSASPPYPLGYPPYFLLYDNGTFTDSDDFTKFITVFLEITLFPAFVGACNFTLEAVKYLPVFLDPGIAVPSCVVVPVHAFSVIIRIAGVCFFLLFVVQGCDSETEQTVYFRVALWLCVFALTGFIVWDVVRIRFHLKRIGAQRQRRTDYLQIQ